MRVLRAVGWMAVGAAISWYAAPTQTETYYQTIVKEVPAVRVPAETPYADSLVDWEEHHRETDCLWVILQDRFGYDITMDRVTAAALWTHELGGACHLIGGEDGLED